MVKGGGGVTSKIYKGEEDADIPDNTEHKSKRTIRRERKNNLNSAILDYKAAIAGAHNMDALNNVYNHILENRSNYSNREFNKIMAEVLPLIQQVISTRRLRNGLELPQFQFPSTEDFGIIITNPMTDFLTTTYQNLPETNWDAIKPSEPPVIPATTPATKPATTPATKPATTPATKPATTPATKPATTPATKPATTPATKPATTPLRNTQLVLLYQDVDDLTGELQTIRVRNDLGKGKLLVYKKGPYNSVQYYKIDLTKRYELGYRMTPMILNEKDREFTESPHKGAPLYFGPHTMGHYYVVHASLPVSNRADKQYPTSIEEMNRKIDYETGPAILRYDPISMIFADIYPDHSIREGVDYFNIPFEVKWSEIK